MPSYDPSTLGTSFWIWLGFRVGDAHPLGQVLEDIEKSIGLNSPALEDTRRDKMLEMLNHTQTNELTPYRGLIIDFLERFQIQNRTETPSPPEPPQIEEYVLFLLNKFFLCWFLDGLNKTKNSFVDEPWLNK